MHNQLLSCKSLTGKPCLVKMKLLTLHTSSFLRIPAYLSVSSSSYYSSSSCSSCSIYSSCSYSCSSYCFNSSTSYSSSCCSSFIILTAFILDKEQKSLDA